MLILVKEPNNEELLVKKVLGLQLVLMQIHQVRTLKTTQMIKSERFLIESEILLKVKLPKVFLKPDLKIDPFPTQTTMLNTTANGMLTQTKDTDMEHRFGLMDLCIKDIGRTTKQMETED